MEAYRLSDNLKLCLELRRHLFEGFPTEIMVIVDTMLYIFDNFACDGECDGAKLMTELLSRRFQ